MSQDNNSPLIISDNPSDNDFMFQVTFTWSEGLTAEHVDRIDKWAASTFDTYITNDELTDKGYHHIHVVCEFKHKYKEHKTAVTHLGRMAKKWVYGLTVREKLPCQQTLKVQHISKDLYWVIGYNVKDHPNHVGRVSKGFENTWIQRCYDKRLAKMKKFGKPRIIKVVDAPFCVFEYSKKYSIKMDGKDDFVKVCLRMENEGISLRNWTKDMKYIYGKTMSLAGDNGRLEHWLRDLLHFM